MTDETVETPAPEPVPESGATAEPAAEAPAEIVEPPPAEEAPAPVVAHVPSASGAERPRATGKRKTSIARVIINRGGDGGITCNGRPIEEYFPRPALVRTARSPLTVTGVEGHVTVVARLDGGGVTGQAGALRHGIARALVEYDENLRPALKREGMLARDARIKERKKAGLRGARKRPQFSKR